MNGSLRFYPDCNPGLSRRRCGRGFSYFGIDGQRIRERAEIARLKALAVPPAYQEVWLSPYGDSHLLATGRDDRRRKQYRYHPDWQQQRSQQKFDRLAQLGDALPRLRGWIDRQLDDAQAGEASSAVAAVLALIDRGALRIGSEVYTRTNRTHGASTLRARHVSFDDDAVELAFTAKGGERVRQRLPGARLQRFLERCQDLPGAPLISWLDEQGEGHGVRSEQVQAVLTEYCGEGITAKALRTWHGTLAAFTVAQQADELTIAAMAEAAAARLHNTPTVSRNSYIHPAVIDLASLETDERARRLTGRRRKRHGLRAGEAELLAYLLRATG